MSLEDHLWHRLDWKHLLAYFASTGLFALVAYALVDYIPVGNEGKLALREACATVVSPMSPKTLLSHFPDDSYTPRCFEGAQGCTSFEADEGTSHFLCADRCFMHWRMDGWGCRVELIEGRARGPGELQNSGGTWSRLEAP